MDTLKSHSADRDVVVRISNGAKGVGQIVIRNTKERIMLGGKHYYKYQIVRPRGYENEEVFHRPERGYAALLSVVFMALAEGSRNKSYHQRQR